MERPGQIDGYDAFPVLNAGFEHGTSEKNAGAIEPGFKPAFLSGSLSKSRHRASVGNIERNCFKSGSGRYHYPVGSVNENAVGEEAVAKSAPEIAGGARDYHCTRLGGHNLVLSGQRVASPRWA